LRDSAAASLIRAREEESSFTLADSRLCSKSCACCIESVSVAGVGIWWSAELISLGFFLKRPNGGTVVLSRRLYQKGYDLVILNANRCHMVVVWE
jgi:hypothetical protein